MSIVYRLVGVVLALAALVFGGWYIGSLRADLETARTEAETAQKALKRTQATLALRERQRAATARAQAKAAASLEAATKSNPTWAESQTPQEVQDALCAHLACASPDGVRNADDSP